MHVAGVPGPGCPATGCTLVQAVANGSVPLSVFNQALATMLYQEQRFGMLGCDQTPVAASCTNPGGIDGNTTGNALLPTGPAHGATPAADLGTKNGDAAVVEKESEEGAVLLKNDASALPITRGDLSGGVLVTGPGAEYTIADPTSEASVGFADRDAISPLEQLQGVHRRLQRVHLRAGELAVGRAGAVVGAVRLEHVRDRAPGPHHRARIADHRLLDQLHHRLRRTASSLLATTPGPGTCTCPPPTPTRSDSSSAAACRASDVTFSLDGAAQKLSTAANVYGTGRHRRAQRRAARVADRRRLHRGWPDQRADHGERPTGGTYHQVTITFDNATSGPASFRFAYSRANGDIADAAAAAKGK